jgi:hypothetical protein
LRLLGYLVATYTHRSVRLNLTGGMQSSDSGGGYPILQ